jgi:hypothetical protein
MEPNLKVPLPLRRSMLLGTLAWIAFRAKSAYAVADSAFALISDVDINRLGEAKGSEMAAFALRRAERVNGRAPKPMETIHVEGTLPHHGIYDQSNEAKQDWAAALDLALAGRLSENRQWLEQSAKILDAWLPVYRPSFNPIDETELHRIFLALDLLPIQVKLPILPTFVKFSQGLAAGYIDRMPRIKGGTATNNWQSHRIKLATLAAFMSGDRPLIDAARKSFAKQLSDNITSDGSVIDFYQRDALHYVVYDLEPLLMAALAARAHGEDWYQLKGSSGAGLKQALRWLEPYAMGIKSHEEFANTTIKFDRERAAAALTGFSGLWDPSSAQDTYALAARLDTDFVALSHKLMPGFTGKLRPTSPWLHLVMPL